MKVYLSSVESPTNLERTGIDLQSMHSDQSCKRKGDISGSPVAEEPQEVYEEGWEAI